MRTIHARDKAFKCGAYFVEREGYRFLVEWQDKNLSDEEKQKQLEAQKLHVEE